VTVDREDGNVEELDVEVVLRGESVKRAEIGLRGLSIGRSPTNDLVLVGRTVSKVHATLSLEKGQLVLTDLQSAHGTFLGGKRIRSSPLHLGDEFQIGQYTFKIVLRAETQEDVSRMPAPSSSIEAFTNVVQVLTNLTGLVGVTDLQLVLESLLEHMMTIFRGTRGFVVLIQNGRLSPILASHGSGSDAEERFSRTVCLRALEGQAPLVLFDTGDKSPLDGIESLSRRTPVLVVAVPLVAQDQVLGVLYLESQRLAPPELKVRPHLLKDVSTLGGRALRAAFERRQLVAEQERWRWLANVLTEDVDIFRTSLSPAMKSSLQVIERAASEDVTVLILGESGTGKDVTAQTIHRLSDRKDKPFIAVNCGAIPHDLMETELFGYEPGAFTGATTQKIGRMEMAQGGTLLLDEIGDLPKDLQVKLLRVLETRTFERLGSRNSIRLNVRVLAATNRDLAKSVERGQFREDLYHRINVVGIWIPPLRDRLDDIEPLVNEMLLSVNRRFKRKLYGMTPEALAALQLYHWPGNVRELRNVIERAFILETGDRITPSSLTLKPGISRPDTAATGAPRMASPKILRLDEYVERQERDYIRLILDRVDSNVTQAARLLGLTRTTLHRKLRTLGMHRIDDAYGGPSDGEESD